MKEIKEILDITKNYSLINNDEIKMILDYITNLQRANKNHSKKIIEMGNKITNLQEENERLREVVENLTTMTVCGDRKQIKNTAQYKLELLQQRIDKAIELLEKYGNGTFDEELLNILQGEDNEG